MPTSENLLYTRCCDRLASILDSDSSRCERLCWGGYCFVEPSSSWILKRIIITIFVSNGKWKVLRTTYTKAIAWSSCTQCGCWIHKVCLETTTWRIGIGRIRTSYLWTLWAVQPPEQYIDRDLKRSNSMNSSSWSLWTGNRCIARHRTDDCRSSIWIICFEGRRLL